MTPWEIKAKEFATPMCRDRLMQDAPFTLMSNSPHAQFNSGGPYWQERVPSAIVTELLENGLIAPIPDSSKPVNQVLRITEKDGIVSSMDSASSAEGV